MNLGVEKTEVRKDGSGGGQSFSKRSAIKSTYEEVLRKKREPLEG